MTTRVITFALAVAAASQLGSTDCGQAISDSEFNLWCGSSLCDWTLEGGTIAEVPTWNQGDPGVSLLADGTAIEQISPVSSSDGTCIDFDLITNIDDDAEVDLGVDLNGDGSFEYSVRIPTSSWKPLSFRLPIQGTYEGIVFRLAKQGDGTAVLAEIGAQLGSDCDGLPPIVAAPGGLGANCGATGPGCEAGLVCYVIGPTPSEYTCATCDPNAGGQFVCDSGQVCGLGAPLSPLLAVPIECIPAAAQQLGEQCITSAECASNICTSGMCSSCGSAGDCTAGQQCEAEWASPLATSPYFGSPWTCAPHARLQPHGAACASNDDCASNTCSGSPRLQCDDGRACTADSDCPFGTSDTSNGLQHGPCSNVGIQGGSCQ